jgi:hypothetical protein
MPKDAATQLVTLAATGALLAALVALGWLGFCTRLAGDDYGWAVARPSEAIDAVTWMYQTAWGRYSSTFLLTLLMPIPHVVELLPAAVLGLWLLALLALFRGLLPDRTWSVSLLAAVATLWATVDGTLSVGRSLYWACAMMTFTAPLVTLTFLAALVIAQSAQSEAAPQVQRIPSLGVCTLAALLGFLSGGFSETNVDLDPLPKDLARWRSQDLAILPNDGNHLENDAIARFYGFESVRYSRAECWPREAFSDEYWSGLTDPANISTIMVNRPFEIPHVGFHRALRKIRGLL